MAGSGGDDTRIESTCYAERIVTGPERSNVEPGACCIAAVGVKTNEPDDLNHLFGNEKPGSIFAQQPTLHQFISNFHDAITSVGRGSFDAEQSRDSSSKLRS